MHSLSLYSPTPVNKQLILWQPPLSEVFKKKYVKTENKIQELGQVPEHSPPSYSPFSPASLHHSTGTTSHSDANEQEPHYVPQDYDPVQDD